MADETRAIGPWEGELLPRIAAGDAEAFTMLFRRRSAEIFRFALHMTGSRAIADDVTQEVFLAVMGDAARYQPGVSSEIAWLRGIARNHVLRRLDGERYALALPGDGDGDDASPASTDAGPLSDLVRAERIEAVRRAVASLPVPYREVVVLCDLQESSYADAAAAIGCSVGTVRSRLSRGRALLASKLGAAEAEETPDGRMAAGGKPQARWAI